MKQSFIILNIRHQQKEIKLFCSVFFCFCSIKSSFQFRTFDPEGAIFYGDTKHGNDWFMLSLKDGIPLMQISRDDVLVSVAGGPKLNNGKWHTVSFRSGV